MKKKLFIIDGHALCYRAYFAFIRNPLVNSSGQNTSAIFGFSRMILTLIRDQNPDYFAIAFDPPVKSFRFNLYEEYKANRQKMPPDLKTQIEEIKNLVREIGIPVIESSDFEADDVLGTVAEKYSSPDIDVYLVTGDKDAYQLISDNVKIYANKKGISDFEIYTSDNIAEKTGLHPELIIDYMALMGDSSDNIPGVKGVGEKTALKLITEYSSLENIYENIESIKGKTKTLLEDGKEMAFLSRDLVTIRKDVPIGLTIDELRFNGLNTEKAVEYYNSLEMNSIVRDYFPETAQLESSTEHEKKDYRTIRTHEELSIMIKELKQAGLFAFDTETDSIKAVEAKLVGMSFSIKEKSGWFLPLQSKGLFSEEFPEPSISISMIKPLLENPDLKKIGQNIKYDFIVLKNEDINLKGIFFDTMIASYLINPSELRHNMDDLAQKYLNYKTITFKELVGTGKNAIALTDLPMDRLAEYAIEDTDITMRLYNIFAPMLKENGLEKLFNEIELPLINVLAEMEITGVKIDTLHFDEMKKNTLAMLDDIEKNIYREADQKFNINSTKELSAILFEKLGLRTVKKTKTGFSTDIKVLETLQGTHPIIDYLISYRTLNKLQNTYIESLPRLISKKTGRIHTSFNQTVTATGRLSSSDPNLQNIPARDDYGKKIRTGFVPGKDSVIMSADYSQIELRLAAHFSNDENMLLAFSKGIDIHNMTASSVFGVPIDEIKPDMRRKAKIINFATIYGVSPYGLSQQAEISIKDAAVFIEKYFQTYPGFKNYIDKTVSFAKKHGYVETLCGRRRPVPEINSTTSFMREGAERAAINMPIQGTSADMIKIAMINIQNDLADKKMKSKMIIQVHDELVFEAKKDELESLKSIVTGRMEKAIKLNVPVVVDIALGENWGEAH
ncbi:MAG: DNA polymerase I [Spirochaetota bacterium]